MIVTYLRTLFLYLMLTVMIRLMGKRQLGQMEPSELVVTMLAADLASIPMQDDGIPLLSGILPIFLILGLELLLSGLSLRSGKARRLLCGKPVILIENGNLLQRNLRRTGVTLDELTGHLRLKGVLELQSVQYAILETNGELSVFPYPEQQPATASDAGCSVTPQSLPVTLVADGRLLRENLPAARKTEAFVKKALSDRKSTVAATFLLTVDALGQVHWVPREEKS